MKKTSLFLVLLVLTAMLFSCSSTTGPQGPIGPQGIQGEEGPQGPQGVPGTPGKDGASFLTGNGIPSPELGKIGDSYLDLTLDEWGLYVKGENGWKLMGYIEAEPAPLTINDLNGKFVLSHVASDSRRYNIGDEFAGMTLSEDMIQVELNEGVGSLTVNFTSLQKTNITCTIEYDMLIMICENAINITGEPCSVYELSIAQGGGGDFVDDGEIYVVLEAFGDYYYVKKIS